MKYFVYKHSKIVDGQPIPFYIGVGEKQPHTGNSFKDEFYRAFSKSSRSQHWHNVVNKYDCTIEIVGEYNTPKEVFEKEIALIKLYGREDLGLGTLVNLTDGGEGSFGAKRSEETRAKLRQIAKNRPPRSLESRRKTSESVKKARVQSPWSTDKSKNVNRASLQEVEEKTQWVLDKDDVRKPRLRGCKLDVSKASEIKTLYLGGILSARQLSEMFNVNKSTILDILHGRRWADFGPKVSPEFIAARTSKKLRNG